MNRNARRRLETVRQSKAQAQRDAAYQAQCERDELTPERRRDRAMGILADVAATLTIADIGRVYGMFYVTSLIDGKEPDYFRDVQSDGDSD